MQKIYNSMKEIFDYINTLEEGKINPFSVINKAKKNISEEELVNLFNSFAWKEFETQDHITKYFAAVLRNKDKEGKINRKDRVKRDISWL